MIYETTTEAFGLDIPVEVHFESFPFMAGSREDGVPMEPDEAAHVEIGEVFAFLGSGPVRVEPSADWISDLEEEIQDTL